MALHPLRRVAEKKTMHDVVARFPDLVEQGAGLRRLIGQPTIGPVAELLLQEIGEQLDERDVAHACNHQFADVLVPAGGHPDERGEFSLERVPAEVDETDAGEMFVVETGPLPSRHRGVDEHGGPTSSRSAQV